MFSNAIALFALKPSNCLTTTASLISRNWNNPEWPSIGNEARVTDDIFSAKNRPIQAKWEFREVAIDRGFVWWTPSAIMHYGIEDLLLRDDASFTAWISTVHQISNPSTLWPVEVWVRFDSLAVMVITISHGLINLSAHPWQWYSSHPTFFYRCVSISHVQI